MANWILSLQADKRINKKELDGTMTEIRNMLETLYVKGDEELRDCLVTATLEHIFTHKKIMHHFKSWKSDAVLGEAYRLSCMYSEKLNNAD